MSHVRNITESELAFRIAVDEPEIATQIQADTYDYEAHYKTWGMVMAYDEYVLGICGWITVDAMFLKYLNLNQIHETQQRGWCDSDDSRTLPRIP